LGYPYIIIYPTGPKVWTRETIAQSPLRSNRTGTDATIHKNPVTIQQGFKFAQHFGEALYKRSYLLPGHFRKISFEPTDPSYIGRKAGAANLFEYFIYFFPPLENVSKRC